MTPTHGARSRVSTQASSSGSGSTSRGNVKACLRCHQKKKRCDLGLPKCRLCRLAGVECLGYDSVARRKVPRDYVTSLEQRVAQLEGKLREQGVSAEEVGRTETQSPISPNATNEVSRQDEASDPQLSPLRGDGFEQVPSASSTGFLGSTEKEPTLTNILLSELTRPKRPLHADNRDTADPSDSSDFVTELDTSPIVLPAREAALKLVNAYFDVTNLSMPLLHRPTFERNLDTVYNLSRTIDLTNTHTTTDSRLAVFFVLEVFAAGILLVQKREPSKTSTWLADRYHNMAAKALSEAGLPNDVTGVQALLLTAQYSYNHPSLCGFWKTVGAALRLAVELGLHRDPSPGTANSLTLDTARRTFWVAYAMDRNVSTNQALPTCLADGAISAEFPSAVVDDFITSDGIPSDAPLSPAKCVGLHLFRYRRIQSEMCVMLHDKPLPFFPPIAITEWQSNMRQRIEQWYADSPRSGNQTIQERRVIETFEVTYNSALFNLYRPAPNIPRPSDTQLLSMSDAAMKMIPLYCRFFRQRMLTIYWQAVENVFSAGIALMYAYSESAAVRESVPLSTIQSLTHTCSSVLWGMVERFPALQEKRDKFDTVSAELMAQINTQMDVSGQDGRLAESRVNLPGFTSFHHGNDFGNVTMPGVQSPGNAMDVLATFTPSAFGNFHDELSLVLDAPSNGTGTFTPTWI